MANPIYTGIDIGSTSIKVVSLRRKGMSYQLLGAGLANLPDNIPAEEDATRIIGGILSRLVRNQKIPIGHTIIGLGSKGSLIRCLSEPICPRWKLAMLMDFEVEEQAGSTAAVAYDFRPLDLPEFQEGQFSVLLGQAQASVVEERLTLARESIKRADELDMSCLGVFNLYAVSPQCDEEKVTLILDVGAEETQVSLQRGSAFYFARTISAGAKRFTARIQQEFKISFEAAEELKLESAGILSEQAEEEEELTVYLDDSDSKPRISDEHGRRVAKACRAEAAVLASAVQSSLVFFRNQLVKSSGTDPRNPKLNILKPQQILLTGGGSHLGGLGEFLGTRLRCTAGILDVAGALPDRRGSAELALEGAHAAQFATAAGLALSRARPDGFGFNILTESEKGRRRFWEQKFYLVAAAIVAIILLVFAVMSSERGLAAARDLDKAWRDRIEKVKQEQVELDQEIANNAMLGEMVNTLEAYRSAGPDLLKTLDILRRNTPEDFFFTSLVAIDLVDKSKPGRRKKAHGSRSRSAAKADDAPEETGRRVLLEGYCLAKSAQDSAARLNQLINDLRKVEDHYFKKVEQIKYTEEASDKDLAPYFEVDGKAMQKDSSTRAFSFSIECFIRPGR